VAKKLPMTKEWDQHQRDGVCKSSESMSN
jgi:hypothetical protein